MSLLKGGDLPILWGGFCEGRGHQLSGPYHMDVWLWGLNTHHEWWTLPQ